MLAVIPSKNAYVMIRPLVNNSSVANTIGQN